MNSISSSSTSVITPVWNIRVIDNDDLEIIDTFGEKQCIELSSTACQYIVQALGCASCAVQSVQLTIAKVFIFCLDGKRIEVNRLLLKYKDQRVQLYKDEILIERVAAQPYGFFDSLYPLQKQSFTAAVDYTLIVVQNVLASKQCDVIQCFMPSVNCNNTTTAVAAGVHNEYPKEVRNNTRYLFKSNPLARSLWKTFAKALDSSELEEVRPAGFGTDGVWIPVAVNSLFRLNRYEQDQHFSKHQDVGYCANNDSRTILSFIIYLNENFSGGETEFYNNDDTVACTVRPTLGTAVLFNHSMWHVAKPVVAGTKYLLRGDIMFSRVGRWTQEQNQSIITNPQFYLVRHLYEQCVLAAQNRQPELSTTLFQQAQAELEATRVKRHKLDEIQAAGMFLTSLPVEIVLKLLSWLGIRALIAPNQCSFATWSRWYYHKSVNQELWRLLNQVHFGPGFLLDQKIMTLTSESKSNVVHPLIDYRLLCRGKLEPLENTEKEVWLYLDIGARGAKVMFDQELYFWPNVCFATEIDLNDVWGHRLANEYEYEVLHELLRFYQKAPQFDELQFIIRPELLCEGVTSSMSDQVVEGLKTYLNAHRVGRNSAPVTRTIFTTSSYFCLPHIKQVQSETYATKYVDPAILCLMSQSLVSGVVIDAGMFSVHLTLVLNLQVQQRVFHNLLLSRVAPNIDFESPINEAIFMELQEQYSSTQIKLHVDNGFCLNEQCSICSTVLKWNPVPVLNYDHSTIHNICTELNHMTRMENIIMVVGGRASVLQQSLQGEAVKSGWNFIELTQYQQLYSALYGARVYQQSGFI